MLVEAVGLLELAECLALEAEAASAALASVWRRIRGTGKARSAVQLREHYVIERELADRLRHAARAERAALYPAVYEELFRRVRHHPQLTACAGTRAAERRASVARQWALLSPFLGPGQVFLEIGAGDCALSLRAAQVAGHVYAVDVSAAITRGAPRPQNLELRLTDGVTLPLADGAAQVAFSNQLIEHLHPEDAAAHLREVQRSLAPGGVYVCITPSRLSGPHDISRGFDERATGLHLREYSARELRALLLAAGFRRIRFLAGARGVYLAVPYALVALVERCCEALPARLGRAVASLAPLRALLGLRVAAIK